MYLDEEEQGFRMLILFIESFTNVNYLYQVMFVFK